jgi:hypothetical protein
MYLQLPAPEGLPGLGLWKALRTIVVVTSLCLRDGKETVEVRYSISSLAMDVKRPARAVRGHWGIENGCHWILDVTYREETPQSWLERELPDASSYRINKLVCAGPDIRGACTRRPSGYNTLHYSRVNIYQISAVDVASASLAKRRAWVA